MTATGFKDETIHLKSTKLQEKRQEKQWGSGYFLQV